MAQHFLHSKEARNFGLRHLDKMGETDIEMLFAQIRWNSVDEQVCPHCASFRKHYRRAHRCQWRCADCDHNFSVTSGSIWANHKLPLRTLLRLIMAYETGANGISTLQLSRMGVTPKTALAFQGKMREAIFNKFSMKMLQGVVHMDGGHFCGKPRKPNIRTRVTPEQLAVRYGKKPSGNNSKPWKGAGMTKANWERRKNRRVGIVLCESAGKYNGSKRSIPIVCFSENHADATFLAVTLIDPNAVVMTDEGPAFSQLGASFEHYAVAHADRFSDPDGVNDNMAETFFSRMRRAEYGTYHGFRPKYLQDYFFEMGWRENNRRVSQLDRVTDLLQKTLSSPVSQWWCGYWQGRNRAGEMEINDFKPRLIAQLDAMNAA